MCVGIISRHLIIPIHWFGDRVAYEKSKVKIVTIGLNPSHMEFRERVENPFSTHTRFRLYQSDHPETLTLALNAYFREKPYKVWFNAFEHVLNGMNASYYDYKQLPYCAIHTDICSPWATDPTWSKLPNVLKEDLYREGESQRARLIHELKPNIILASLGNEYIEKLGIENSRSVFYQFEYKKNEEKRTKPEIIWKYEYHGIPIINGRAWQTPFAKLSEEARNDLGRMIMERLLQ